MAAPNGETNSLIRFHVAATGHSLNYLPEYIANRRGFFKEQGLEVTVSVPKPWDLVLDELADGTADAALGGIWVPSMYYATIKDYKAFAQLANRCPLALIRRGSSGPFKLADVVGKTVLMKSGNGASVGLFFKMLLRENGIDPNSVGYIQDLDGIMLSKLFQGGMGEYFLIDNASARLMAQNNPDVSVAMEMVTHGGDIPWSVYYCELETITPAVLDVQKRFCAALIKGTDYVLHNDAETYKDDLAALFPATPIDLLVELTNTYKRDGMWSSPLVGRHSFDRWQKGIVDGHLTRKPFAYEILVDDGPVQAAKSILRDSRERRSE